MPGLKQAGKVANDRLVTHRAKYGYAPCKRTPALWKHESRPITFTLCVDKFGIKYFGKQHSDHLLNALQNLCSTIVDWKGELYLGLTSKWDYIRRQVNLSMPDYIPSVLLRFQHPTPSRNQHSPHAWTTPNYVAKRQYAMQEDETELLPPSGIFCIQQIIGSLLYYALAVDCTFLVDLGDLAPAQTKASDDT